MALPTIFDTCRPRPDVLDGAVADADFAADLAQVLTGRGSAAYRDPVRFFANTWPTRGLKRLLANVCRRLSGAGGGVGPIFRLDTAYGGGKTHGLIALAHAAGGPRNAPGAAELAEIESVSARKATLLNPTEEDETVQVLRRRLFETIDAAAVPAVVDAYRAAWAAAGEAAGAEAARPETAGLFRASYPLHPHVLQTLTGKTATLANFQRVRGMLRLLARTVAHLWRRRPADATAIHLHHVDPGDEPTRQELVTRLGQSAFLPAITHDVAAGRVAQPALAEALDAAQHRGLPPYAAYAARTIFMHTLAFNEPLKGLSPEQLRYAAIGPAVDASFLDDARKAFVADSAYLDDRPGAPLRFLAEANLGQIIRREEQHVDAGEARAQLDDRIRRIFDGRTFDAVPFPGGPFDVPDEVGDGRPKLVVFAYDGVTVGGTVDGAPPLVERVYERAGADGAALRKLRNHLVFVAADGEGKAAMRGRMLRRLAFELEFRGPVPDAQPVREFLEPQLRDAADRTVEAGFELAFADGLPLAGDAAEKLADRLCRFAGGAAHVSATAEAKP